MTVTINYKTKYKDVINVTWEKDFLVMTISEGKYHTTTVSYPMKSIDSVEVKDEKANDL